MPKAISTKPKPTATAKPRPADKPKSITKRYDAVTKLPEIYFEYKTGTFFMELAPERFVNQSAADIKNRLKMREINADLKNNYGLTHGDEILANVQSQKFVDYAGPLAGYKAGLHLMSGDKRVLVTSSCKPVVAGHNKRMPFLEKFIGQLLDGQEVFFYSWLKLRWESLVKGMFTPSQMLVLGGPAGCGKTFLQWIVTQVLGGRSAKPYAFMMGGTNFNEDVAESEHLAMGDEEASYDIRSRKKFAAKIKQMTVEPELWIQGKGKKAITLETRRALSLCVNDEPEHMLIIPPLDSDMIGKITILKCHPVKCLSQDRQTNQDNAKSELPALAAFLRDWKIPADIRDSRFGVKAFQEKSLMEMLCDSNPEQQLLVIIDEVIFSEQAMRERVNRGVSAANNEADKWRGSAEQLKVELLKSEHYGTVSSLLNYASNCGTYLARLKSKLPSRFESKRSNGKNGWLIRKEK